MSFILDFLIKMLPFMLISGFVCVLIRRIKVKSLRSRGFEVSRVREILILVFVMLMAGILSQTVLPDIVFSDGQLSFIFADYSEINLKPFRVLRFVLNDFAHGSNYSFIINLLANILLFVPEGLGISLLFGKARYGILFTALTSFFIEFVQLFIGRSTDIDDIILNTLGGVIGVLFFLAIRNTRFASAARTKPKKII